MALKRFIIFIILVLNYFLVSINTTIGLILTIVSVVLVLIEIKTYFKRINLYILFFLLFFFLYNFSYPISLLIFENAIDNEVSETFTAFYLKEANIALLAIYWAVILQPLKYFKEKITKGGKLKIEERRIYLLVILAVLFEGINFFRVGGKEVLVMGKAVYQAKISELFLTLPSYTVSDITVALLGIYLSTATTGRKKTLITFFVFFSPLVILTAFLGQRGPILSWIMIYFLSNNLGKIIKTINIKLFFYGVIVYFFLVSIYLIRSMVSYGAQTGDYAFVSSRLGVVDFSKVSNPANNEFGAGFLNFYSYWSAPKDLVSFPGQSYLEGMVIAIPGFLYPAEKPKQITYKFRDYYYSNYADKSRIAGTGFSSLLEAYVNFNEIGIFFVYFFVSFCIIKCDRILINCLENKLTKTRIIIILTLLTIPSVLQTFHRAGFGGAIAELFYQYLTVTFIIHVFKPIKFRYEK